MSILNNADCFTAYYSYFYIGLLYIQYTITVSLKKLYCYKPYLNNNTNIVWDNFEIQNMSRIKSQAYNLGAIINKVW